MIYLQVYVIIAVVVWITCWFGDWLWCQIHGRKYTWRTHVIDCTLGLIVGLMWLPFVIMWVLSLFISLVQKMDDESMKG